MTTRRLATLAAAAVSVGLTATLAGCFAGPYRPAGSQYSIDQFTYISYPHSPKTVELVDTRTGEIVWAVDVPVGQQLTFRFYENREKDNPITPAMMRWDMYEANTRFGRKNNTLLVPPAEARRIEMHVRPGVEYPPDEPVITRGE